MRRKVTKMKLDTLNKAMFINEQLHKVTREIRFWNRYDSFQTFEKHIGKEFNSETSKLVDCEEAFSVFKQLIVGKLNNFKSELESELEKL